MLIVPQGQIRPLSLRGVNYYPRDNPWKEGHGMWGTPSEVWRADMARAAALHINTVRVFIEDLLAREPNGAFRQDELAKFEAFLSIAAEFRIRAIVCGLQLGGDLSAALANRSLILPHVNDGRILMWDLINEPGEEYDYTALATALDEIKSPWSNLDPNHLTTVGGHHFVTARLAGAGGLPDVVQYHEYDSDIILLEGAARVRWKISTTRALSGERPIFIGECGESTDPDDGLTEDQHLQLLTYIIEACEREQIAGLLPWTLFDFGVPVFKPRERRFGLFRTDYSLKPGGEYIRLVFRQWWKRDQLDPTFGFVKNARLWCDEGREEPQDGHENWAHHQTESVVRAEVRALTQQVLAAVDTTSDRRLAEAFGHMKNARLRIDEGMWEPHEGHVHWAMGQSRGRVQSVVRDQATWVLSRL